MKVLLPFWDLNIIDRYITQFQYLRDQLEELVIMYERGQPNQYYKDFTFTRFQLPKSPHRYWSWYIGRESAPSFVPPDLDLVYSLSGLWMNIYGQAISDFWCIPHVIRMRGSMADSRKYQGKGKLQRILFEKAHTKSFRDATLVTPIAEKFIPWLKTIGLQEDQIGEVVPNGVDLDMFAPIPFKEEPHNFYVGYAGRISEEKGSQFLLQLIKECPEITFVLTGEIQDKKFIPPNNCNYFGKTPYDLMPDFYALCDVLIFPSYSEGQPNGILEAYSMKKPIVTSPDALPMEMELFGSLCMLELGAWTEVIRDMHTFWKTGEFWRIADLSRQYVRDNYSWDNYARGLKRQFDKAIRRYDSLNPDQE